MTPEARAAIRKYAENFENDDRFCVFKPDEIIRLLDWGEQASARLEKVSRDAVALDHDNAALRCELDILKVAVGKTEAQLAEEIDDLRARLEIAEARSAKP